MLRLSSNTEGVIVAAAGTEEGEETGSGRVDGGGHLADHSGRDVVRLFGSVRYWFHGLALFFSLIVLLPTRDVDTSNTS